MAVAYPNDIVFWPRELENQVDIVLAEHVNDLRHEVVAIESTLGAAPLDGYPTIKDRIADQVSKRGGAIIRRDNSAVPALGLSASNSGTSIPVLEVLKEGVVSWGTSQSVTDRSVIRLWGSGMVDAAGVSTARSDVRLSITATDADFFVGTKAGMEKAALSTSGVLRLGRTAAVFDGSQFAPARVDLNISSSTSGVRITTTSGAVPIEVYGPAGVVFRVSHDGSLSAGDILLDPVADAIRIGTAVSLSPNSLVLGDINLTDQGLSFSISGGGSTSYGAGGAVFRNSSGTSVAAVGSTGITFGATGVRLLKNAITLGGLLNPDVPSVELTSQRLTFLTDSAEISASAGLVIKSAQTSIAMGSTTMAISAPQSVGLVAGTQNAVFDSSGVLSLGAGSLSQSKLVLSTRTFVDVKPTKGLQISTPDKVQIGLEGPALIPTTEPFRQYIEITDIGTTVSGALDLPNNPTWVWPAPSDVKNLYIMGTLPKKGGPSDLEPSYWGPFHKFVDGLPHANTDVDFFAPAGGNVRITISAEMWGNVSRSAISYQLYDLVTGQLLLDNGGGHQLSFNAPVAETPADIFYANMSNVNVLPFSMVPYRRYRLRFMCQRAVPGADAVDYSKYPAFAGNTNYSSTYPWGRWFPVKFLRAIIEPVFTIAHPSSWPFPPDLP